MANLRTAVRAGSFYPADAASVKRIIQEFLRQDKGAAVSGRAVAAVAPHAGWSYSGRIAMKTVKALLDHSEPATLVLFGAVHAWGVRLPSMTTAERWETPLGDLPVDSELRETLLGSAAPLEADDHAHAGEHSIEVLLPFVQAFSTNIRILPIATPPVPEALEVGRAVGALAAETASIIALASTDLTHYGPDFYGFAPRGVGEKALRWVKEENDARIIRLMLDMNAAEIIPEAGMHHNACGPGAVAAAVAFAQTAGATRGVLIEYATSHDVKPYGEPSDFVGYAGVLFEKAENY